MGIYPTGTDSYGHCDLAGNVWEWCVDGEDSAKEWRTLKGGGWFAPAAFLRSSVCRRSLAEVRNDDYGFRVAALSVSP